MTQTPIDDLDSANLPLFCMVYSSHIRYSTLYNHQIFSNLAYQVISNNHKNGISGILCFGNGYFLQYIEGTEEALTNLKNRLLQDTRHYGLSLSNFSEIDERLFSDLQMGFVMLEKQLHPKGVVFKNYMPFKPMTWTFQEQMVLIKELQEQGLYYQAFKLGRINTLKFQIRLFFQLIKENITKDQMTLVVGLIVFSALVLFLFLNAITSIQPVG